MARLITKGTTDVSDYIYIQDSADGTAETAITVTGLDMQYTRDNTAPTAKVDATSGSLTTHSDNTIIEVDATDQPGLYKVDWPDAVFASGVDHVVCTVSGTGFAPVHREFILTSIDLFDAVRGGMTALPNAAANAAGGLPISTAGGFAIDSITAPLIADAVWDESITDHLGGAKAGEYITAILLDTGTNGVVLANDAITAAKIADDAITSDQLGSTAVDAIWNQIVETVGSRTAQQVLSICLSALAGVTTDSGATFKDSAGTNTRISATVNGSNERTAVTLTPSS